MQIIISSQSQVPTKCRNFTPSQLNKYPSLNSPPHRRRLIHHQISSMGCCISTNNTPPPSTDRISNSKTTTKHGPLLEEEEIVKEILSETPALAKPPPPTIPQFSPDNAGPFIKSAPLLRETEHQNGVVYKKPFAADDASDVSEICSIVSESVSASTSVTEKIHRKDESPEVRQRSPARLRNRPFSAEMHREKAVGRSPGRMSEPSPGRVRPVNGSGYGRRRESTGERSGRRSTSPAMRAESGMGRGPSARRTGKSPGRGGPGSGDRIRKLDGGKESPSGEGNWAPTSVNNESLENPLVSLECFIFL